MCRADQLGSAAKFRTRAGCRHLGDGFAAPNQRAGEVSVPAPASLGTDSPVSIDSSSRTAPAVMRTSAATTPPRRALPCRRAPDRLPVWSSRCCHAGRRRSGRAAPSRLPGSPGAPLLRQSEHRIEDQEAGYDPGLDIFAEHQLENYRRFEHPRDGCPELAQRLSQRASVVSGSRLARSCPASPALGRWSGRWAGCRPRHLVLGR